jgi:hypothetical protein
LQTFVAGQFFVKIAVRFLSLRKAAKFFSLFSSLCNYELGSDHFRANLIADWMNPHPYFFIIIFIGVALVFPLVPLALAWLWRRFF